MPSSALNMITSATSSSMSGAPASSSSRMSYVPESTSSSSTGSSYSSHSSAAMTFSARQAWPGPATTAAAPPPPPPSDASSGYLSDANFPSASSMVMLGAPRQGSVSSSALPMPTRSPSSSTTASALLSLSTAKAPYSYSSSSSYPSPIDIGTHDADVQPMPGPLELAQAAAFPFMGPGPRSTHGPTGYGPVLDLPLCYVCHRRRVRGGGRPGGPNLTKLFPDLLPTVKFCVEHLQRRENTFPGRSSSITATDIREIIIDCVPGIKERGGIGYDTVLRLVRQAKGLPVSRGRRSASSSAEAQQQPTVAQATTPSRRRAASSSGVVAIGNHSGRMDSNPRAKSLFRAESAPASRDAAETSRGGGAPNANRQNGGSTSSKENDNDDDDGDDDEMMGCVSLAKEVRVGEKCMVLDNNGNVVDTRV